MAARRHASMKVAIPSVGLRDPSCHVTSRRRGPDNAHARRLANARESVQTLDANVARVRAGHVRVRTGVCMEGGGVQMNWEGEDHSHLRQPVWSAN